MKTNNICKNCNHWKNKQAELEYSTFEGICTCFKHKFTITNYSSAKVLDRKNISNKYTGINRFESQSDVVPIGQVEKSRYCLVTSEEFGCIHFSGSL